MNPTPSLKTTIGGESLELRFATAAVTAIEEKYQLSFLALVLEMSNTKTSRARLIFDMTAAATLHDLANLGEMTEAQIMREIATRSSKFAAKLQPREIYDLLGPLNLAIVAALPEKEPDPNEVMATAQAL